MHVCVCEVQAIAGQSRLAAAVPSQNLGFEKRQVAQIIGCVLTMYFHPSFIRKLVSFVMKTFRVELKQFGKEKAAKQKYDRGGGGGGAGVRDCKAADYPHEVSACGGQELGRAKAPLAPLAPLPQLHRPCDKVFKSDQLILCSMEPVGLLLDD